MSCVLEVMPHGFALDQFQNHKTLKCRVFAPCDKRDHSTVCPLHWTLHQRHPTPNRKKPTNHYNMFGDVVVEGLLDWGSLGDIAKLESVGRPQQTEH